ncbi:Helix-turn-helix domain protein [compost metagenome]
MSESLLTPPQVAAQLAVDLRTLQYWRDTKQGPAYVRISPKIIRYRREDVNEFLQSRTK